MATVSCYRATARQPERKTDEKQECNKEKKSIHCKLVVLLCFSLNCNSGVEVLSRLVGASRRSVGSGRRATVPTGSAINMWTTQHRFSSILRIKKQNFFILKSNELNMIWNSQSFVVSRQTGNSSGCNDPWVQLTTAVMDSSGPATISTSAAITEHWLETISKEEIHAETKV